MSIGTGAALALGLGTAAAGVASSAIGAHSAGSAADQQKAAAQAAIDEQKRQYDLTRSDLQPWTTAGTGALSQLTSGTAPGGSLVTPYGATYQTPGAFVAPTLDNTNDPGYAFRLASGEQALARGAAAGGGAFSGGTLAALTRYGQDYASNEYQNVYNRALGTYNTNVNTGLNAYNTQFNAYNTGQTNQFNRLAALAGMGQSSTNTLVNAGANAANQTSDLLTQQGNAGAAGTLGTGSAINNGINSVLGGLTNDYLGGSLIKALTGGSAQPLPIQPSRNPYQITGTYP
jgi:hypothetical protein